MRGARAAALAAALPLSRAGAHVSVVSTTTVRSLHSASLERSARMLAPQASARVRPCGAAARQRAAAVGRGSPARRRAGSLRPKADPACARATTPPQRRQCKGCTIFRSVRIVRPMALPPHPLTDRAAPRRRARLRGRARSRTRKLEVVGAARPVAAAARARARAQPRAPHATPRAFALPPGEITFHRPPPSYHAPRRARVPRAHSRPRLDPLRVPRFVRLLF